MKSSLLLFGILTFFNALCVAQQQGKINKIVIDAGHGGADPGCLGKKGKEKEVNLAVALRLGKLISEHHEDMEILYTRKTDMAVELYKRADMANKNHADLFISIHCNAADNKNARGIETFVMGLDKSEASLAVAKKENAAILKESNYKDNYDGFDPNSPESTIAFSIYSSGYLKYSAMLADKVQRNLVRNTPLPDRQVKQAAYWVLYKVAMPSILIELGFLSNAQEENFLIKPENQDLMARSIYNAFTEYKNQVEGTRMPLLPVSGGAAPSPTPAGKPAPGTEGTPSIPATLPAVAVEEDPRPPTPNGKNGEVIRFCVQFMTSEKDIPLDDKRFSTMKGVKKYHENNLWKFTTGDEALYEDALALLRAVKRSYSDAFLIAYKDNLKISIPEAKALLKK